MPTEIEVNNCIMGLYLLASVAWSIGPQPQYFFASDFPWCCLAIKGSPAVTQHVVYVESSSLLLHSIRA